MSCRIGAVAGACRPAPPKPVSRSRATARPEHVRPSSQTAWTRAVGAERRGFPSARAGHARRRNRARRREGRAAVGRGGRANARDAGALRDPDHVDGGPFTSTRGGCSPLALASPSTSLTRTGRRERAPAVVADGAVDVGSLRAARRPRGGDPVAVGRQRDVRVGQPGTPSSIGPAGAATRMPRARSPQDERRDDAQRRFPTPISRIADRSAAQLARHDSHLHLKPQASPN